jgi:LmbE family N-acetylglucosaminyl deacetylase
MPTVAHLGRLVVIAPHLDDAVLSCGQLLAAHPGSEVVTLFAGIPGLATPPSDWDRRCGFDSAAQAMQQRREEDRIALSLLEARAVWLEFLDTAYGLPEQPDEVAQALRDALQLLDPQTVLLPLGLYHADHLLAHEASTLAVKALPDARVLLYEDVPYRAMRGLLQQRLMALAQGGVCLTPMRCGAEGSAAAKAHALQAYASQLRGFGGVSPDDAAAPERCWLDEAAEAGDER